MLIRGPLLSVLTARHDDDGDGTLIVRAQKFRSRPMALAPQNSDTGRSNRKHGTSAVSHSCSGPAGRLPAQFRSLRSQGRVDDAYVMPARARLGVRVTIFLVRD
jgi:hypothetical protein